MNAGKGPQLVGRSAERRVVISDSLVLRFANTVGDHNPIHVDPEAAGRSQFGQPIAHGMLLGSLFSGLIAEELPGPGSIYISQTLRFRRPVVVGSTVTASVRCLSIDGDRVTLETTVFDSAGERVVVGDAVVLLPSLGSTVPA